MQFSAGLHFTRTTRPDVEYFGKLIWMMVCLLCTGHLTKIASIDDEGDACTYTCVAHELHADLKGHSRLVVTIGRGAITNISKKLGVMTLSLTETEVLSHGERFPKCT